ncbi:MAG: tRNA pseudouridine(55) synthase TruB [Paludibacteraceae bacterium]|nr:tRNA pseudouridine(55) synthase TruB [Paludibacteraceae bacterium]
MDFIQGEILPFDKPYRWTSFDLVAKVRYLICRHLGIKKLKVGHTGTLDPLATGVMVICTGKKTKLIKQLQQHQKQYIATLQLGATTPSFDLEKPIDQTFPTQHINLNLIQNTLTQFQGDILQVPPTFSAVKIDGKRAYDYARQGQDIQIQPKNITISQLHILNYNQPLQQLTLSITCSKGTYIRALARDIGIALQSGAHLIQLQRTQLGDISLHDCLTIEQFQEMLQNTNPSNI